MWTMYHSRHNPRLRWWHFLLTDNSDIRLLSMYQRFHSALGRSEPRHSPFLSGSETPGYDTYDLGAYEHPGGSILDPVLSCVQSPFSPPLFAVLCALRILCVQSECKL